ncbi:hypothetical protein LPJ58_001831 [Coemansia sp. RSA 1591]|nr:hypothetical protein LPJ58_001831 [Coemansia sp. RSA 1591]KAJ1764557.1 hypothetical protein LPJ69_001767 [Coemansia sp. RSA 1752]KAJ1791894.1 hypothetical protein LPJ67_001721 [Coemansia sp. RSA 1938]KAJ2446705.1 hypothetical protein IWW46_000759 [Coemansia sp. RSA 2440]
MKFCAVTALMLAGHAAAYDILRASKLNCREKPTTKSDLVKVYELGDNIDIVCQTNGQKQMGSTVWDMTPDGCYVLDYYLYTGYSGIFMPLCEDMESGVSAKPSQSESKDSKDSKTSGSDDNESVSESGGLDNIDSEESEDSEDSEEVQESLVSDSELGGESEDGTESEDSEDSEDSDESESSNAMSLANGSCALIVAGLVASLF